MNRIRIAQTRRTVAVLARVGALTLLCACGGASPLVEHTVMLGRSHQSPCSATVNGQRRPANRLMLEVYQLTEPAEQIDRSREACEACVAGNPAAPCILEQSQCLCPGQTDTRLESLRRTASGLRAQQLEPGVYCARLLVLELRGSLASTAEPECTCEGLVMQRNTIRACGLSLPIPIGLEQETGSISLPLRCYDDPSPAPDRDHSACERGTELAEPEA